MRLVYIGPRTQIEIAGYGVHAAGEVKAYPDAVGAELLSTSVRQIFQSADTDADADNETAPEHKKSGKRRAA